MGLPGWKKDSTRLLYLFVGVVVLCSGSLILLKTTPWPDTDVNGYGQYGAFLQGVAGSVALLLLWYTVYLQQRELRLQREELKLQREEVRLTREEMVKNTTEQARQGDQLAGQLAEFKRQGDLQVEQMERPTRHVFNLYREHDDYRIRNDGQGAAYEVAPQIDHQGTRYSLQEFVLLFKGQPESSRMEARNFAPGKVWPSGEVLSILQMSTDMMTSQAWQNHAAHATLIINCNNIFRRPQPEFRCLLSEARIWPRAG